MTVTDRNIIFFYKKTLNIIHFYKNKITQPHTLNLVPKN